MGRVRALLCCVFALVAATSHALEQPTGQVLLTVSGSIEQTNVGNAAEFDLEMLQNLPVTEFQTTTIWTDGVQTFTGVSVAALLDALDADGREVVAHALNDYAVNIPMNAFESGAPIIAYLHNGNEMSLRTKGPLWIVYPYDHDTDYQTDIAFLRSVWQLDRLTVLE
ncbi:molybdopterin-dependent oxidoreductase [Pontivivens insulae]|uniref:Oxidoreductase molybdopterin-binding domain-containing protein n=1 Tax=Pontivivens insulae TaxID=1639689 RepID=A0A2R8ABC0_9RHOB|nr:molybdopterin-dependent oxidoreductase [Pontivivens insulae]SPF29549.1 hypothetical protein POI8812_01861 [Pontivivens insulae]